MEYKEEDFLQLSGIQHVALPGHPQGGREHVHATGDKEIAPALGKPLVMGVLVHQSPIRGAEIFRPLVLDMDERPLPSAEFKVLDTGKLKKVLEGLWQPYPVEYKRGKPSERAGDTLQLCAQSMCLEEMLCWPVPEGALYYGESRRRMPVAFTEELRQTVKKALTEMHQLYQRGHTPKVKPTKACNACSLKELCLPRLMRAESVQDYLHRTMEEEKLTMPKSVCMG